MANPEHLKILKQGVEAWNAWREEKFPKVVDDGWSEEHATESIDLSGANLSNAKLIGVNLSAARLECADFHGADLRHARLDRSNVRGANLSCVNLRYANLLNLNLELGTFPELSREALTSVNFKGASLYQTNLSGAQLIGANFNGASLLEANLSDSILWAACFISADLARAKLTRALLFKADFAGADLFAVDFSCADLNQITLNGANVGLTIFANVDLSEVAGLDNMVHTAPSTVGIDTIYKSQGQIPDKFLQNAGVPEEIIDIARSIRAGPAIQSHSCFISYSTKDEEFARRLHARMREANMRVWFAPEDLKGGKKLHEQLFEAVQIHDRLLIVLSAHSIQSEWVMTEIRKAREAEKNEKRRKLFPIRLCDFESLRDWTCFDADTGKDSAVEVREYFIPDFSNWKNHDAFESAFARLKKDLEAENSKK